ncbi:hypothetical protein [Cryobacterium sp. TMT1-2-2]|uniref:hypothetical protein n=1 Tax=Cryobacterium sp. TMT1-2-2 TaxID=1259233 RepID=UPI00141AF8D2|nr:hypothetical protein [Cryobacterium sp. TMT1-2-2]
MRASSRWKESSPERQDSRRLTWVLPTVDGRKTLEGHLAALAQIAGSQPDAVN